MSPKRPLFTVPWDELSDQPHRIKDGSLRRQLRRQSWGEYLRMAATAVISAPHCLAAYLQGPSQPCTFTRAGLGVALTPLPDETQRLQDLVAALGVQHLQIRCPWQAGIEQDRVRRFLELFAGHKIHLVFVQDRQAVCQPYTFAAAVDVLCAQVPQQVQSVQLGNASNRLKWGCSHIGEYLDMLDACSSLPQRHPRLRFAASSVIDFEPLPTIRSLINWRRWHFDACAALLYVDRRGAPESTQYGIFDARRKMLAVAAALRCSRRFKNHLWLTEVNWPLQGHGAHAPTSPKECVSEVDAARYLHGYFDAAHASKVVDRVYVWQLVAKGYGLVDPDDWRCRPAYRTVAEWQPAS